MTVVHAPVPGLSLRDAASADIPARLRASRPEALAAEDDLKAWIAARNASSGTGATLDVTVYFDHDGSWSGLAERSRWRNKLILSHDHLFDPVSGKELGASRIVAHAKTGIVQLIGKAERQRG